MKPNAAHLCAAFPERETGLEPANLLVGNQTLYQLSYSRVTPILP